MSSIPQRKKTPEELAALRAQEFSQTPDHTHAEPTPPLPADKPAENRRFMPPEKHGVFHDQVGQRINDLTPAHAEHPTLIPGGHTSSGSTASTRKAPPEKRGVIHAFDGLRPDAASEISLGPHGSIAQLPDRKHENAEIQQLRHRGLMQTRPPVQHLTQMALNPILAGILYIVAIATVYLTAHYWSYDGQQRFYSPAAGCSFLLLVSLLLYFKKPRARHHAAFLSGISLLILGFVILLTLKNPYAP
jgi:hypothetical protein